MSTKIQINSLEALERLIGGDSELEVEMRKSIAYDFTTKHLKALANDPYVMAKMEEARHELRKIVDENVKARIGQLVHMGKWPYSQWIFATDVKEHIDKAIEAAIGEFVQKEVSATVERRMKDIEYKISAESYRQINEKIQAGVKERLTAIQTELAKLPELIKKD
jgi:hypothetical protein